MRCFGAIIAENKKITEIKNKSFGISIILHIFAA
jgi:hypothetical protein